MTIKELLENLGGMGSEREKPLLRLMKELSPVSISSLMKYQADWNSEKTWEEFKEAQNKLVKECVELECSEFGRMVRSVLNLPPFNLNLEV